MQNVKFWGVSVYADCEGKTTKDLAFFTTKEEAEKFSARSSQ